jgi:hypothetical protein
MPQTQNDFLQIVQWNSSFTKIILIHYQAIKHVLGGTVALGPEN